LLQNLNSEGLSSYHPKGGFCLTNRDSKQAVPPARFGILQNRSQPFESPGAASAVDSLGAEEFCHVPECFVEFEIFIDAFDSSALGHPASVGSAARVVALTAAENVFLNRVEG